MFDGTAHLTLNEVVITGALRDDMTPLALTYTHEQARDAWHAIANRGNNPGTNWLPMAYTWRRA
jgi:hypothetical protein